MQCLTLSRAVRNFRILSNVIAVWVRKWFEYNIVIYIYIYVEIVQLFCCAQGAAILQWEIHMPKLMQT